MNTQKFKTNIKCAGCIATVTPVLNKIAGENKWEVDLQDPDKTLTIESDATESEIATALKDVGYEARS